MSEGEGGIASIWAGAAVAQAVAARTLHLRGDGGTSMPFRAFCVASLIVGSGACIVGGVLHAAGLTRVSDFVKLGEQIRQARKHSSVK